MAKLKGAALKALGLPATEDMKREHYKLRKKLQRQKDDVNKLNAILGDLQAKYNRHKYQIFFIRHWLMKRMIKSAVERLRQVLNDREDQSTETEVEGQGHWKEYGENMKKIDDYVKYYSELSADQVGKDLSNFRTEIKQLEKESLKKRRLLEQLGTDYHSSKSMPYSERYQDMKRMIRATFPPPPPPGDHHHQRLLR